MSCLVTCCATSTCGLCNCVASGITKRSARLAYCGLFGGSLILSWVLREVAAPLLEKIPCQFQFLFSFLFRFFVWICGICELGLLCCQRFPIGFLSVGVGCCFAWLMCSSILGINCTFDGGCWIRNGEFNDKTSFELWTTCIDNTINYQLFQIFKRLENGEFNHFN